MVIRLKRKTLDDLSPLGPEPEWEPGADHPLPIDLMRALTWYANSWEQKKSVSEFIKRYRGPEEIKAFLRQADISKAIPTVCHLVVMASRGCNLEPKHVKRINDHIIELISPLKQKQQERVGARVVSIQDHVQARTSAVVGHVDGEFDKFYFGGFVSEFKLYEWLQATNIKPLMCSHIVEAYQAIMSEFVSFAKVSMSTNTLDDNDTQLVEGYGHLKRQDLLKVIQFVQSIIADATRWGDNIKKTKGSRKKKEVSVEVQIKKVQYQKEHTPLKITSIRPENIIGAQQVWTFNTKKNVLSVFNARGSAGLSVKGTTIQNFDEESSVMKRVRKPAAVTSEVLKGGKIILRKLIESINSKSYPAAGRLNVETVILRAIK